MRRPLVALTLGFALSVTPALAQETWTIDTSHSAAHFAVRHMLVSTVRGDLGPVKGTVTWDGKDARTVEVEAVIDVTQLDSRNEGRDKDLRSANFFEVEKYPEMTFKSTRVTDVTDGGFKLVGNLTMHGVTKEVTLDVEGPTSPVKVRDRLRTGATATTTLNRFDFGLNWNRMVETGGLVVSEEVKVTIDLELVQQAPSGNDR
jgi:polyisoprenoid-binding protein YceI